MNNVKLIRGRKHIFCAYIFLTPFPLMSKVEKYIRKIVYVHVCICKGEVCKIVYVYVRGSLAMYCKGVIRNVMIYQNMNTFFYVLKAFLFVFILFCKP